MACNAGNYESWEHAFSRSNYLGATVALDGDPDEHVAGVVVGGLGGELVREHERAIRVHHVRSVQVLICNIYK